MFWLKECKQKWLCNFQEMVFKEQKCPTALLFSERLEDIIDDNGILITSHGLCLL